MKFGIDIGHNCPPDTGAQGIKSEDSLTLDLGNRVIAKLKNLGHEVISCLPAKADTVKESLEQRCSTANAANVDIFVSIHFNSFNSQANGAEIFAMSEPGKKIAYSVLEEIIKLGFLNRSVKNGKHLFVLKHTNMPAILIEACFIDSQKDINLYNPEAMANAIVKGLTS
ncbi:N-acetylmuramoyl-L-alanine amidase [Nostocales cyanobacterium HT-58-2]|nr:N-acetylmuramoyl-L-alanine amidase [Nostocales cyanobacterium HT-58-2]